MRMSRFHRLGGTVAGLVLLLSLGASAVLAKEGVEVTLAAPISRDAQPGEVVAVFFRLAAITDTGTAPLRGSDVFIRLYGPTGAMTQAAGAEQRDAGLYKAMIEIPAGGPARAEFGIHGTAKDVSGKTVASDIVWPYDGILVTAAVPAAPRADPAAGTKPAQPAGQPALDPGTATATSPAASSPAGSAPLDVRLALVAAVAAGLAVALALVVGRRRRVNRSAA